MEKFYNYNDNYNDNYHEIDNINLFTSFNFFYFIYIYKWKKVEKDNQ